MGKCVVGGAGLIGVGEFETIIAGSSGAGDGDACLTWLASPISGSAALWSLLPWFGWSASWVNWPTLAARSTLSMTTSLVGEAAMVRTGDCVWRARRAGDWEPLDRDLVEVGLAGDHPSDGVAGAHS